jgi:mono/diheme cytochrome c family protein
MTLRSTKWMMDWRMRGALALLLCAMPLRGQSADAAFQQSVQPIIAKNCAGCHILGGHSGGLRMDSLAALLKGGEDGPVIVWGKPEKSLLTKTIHYEDPDMAMPPKGKLSDADIATIDKWIAQSSPPIGGDAPAPVAATAAPSDSNLTAIGEKPVAALVAPKPERLVHATGGLKPVAVVSVTAASPLTTAEQEAFFESKVRPVLINNCYSCHASAAHGGLRLDSREALLRGGKNGPVVVPGHPEQSRLATAVHYSDTNLQMPPAGALKADQVADIDRWIADGMPWPKGNPVAVAKKITDEQRRFWAFQPPIAPVVPDVKSPWVKNDIDRFVLAKLDEKKLKPVGYAGRGCRLRIGQVAAGV